MQGCLYTSKQLLFECVCFEAGARLIFPCRAGCICAVNYVYLRTMAALCSPCTFGAPLSHILRNLQNAHYWKGGESAGQKTVLSISHVIGNP